MASWSIPWSLSGWHKNELCRIILHSWLIHFTTVDAFEHEEGFRSFEGIHDGINFFVRVDQTFNGTTLNGKLKSVHDLPPRGLHKWMKNDSRWASTTTAIQIKVRLVYNLLNCWGMRDQRSRWLMQKENNSRAADPFPQMLSCVSRRRRSPEKAIQLWRNFMHTHHRCRQHMIAVP